MKRKIKYYYKRVKNGRLKEVFQCAIWIYSYAKQHLFSIVLYTVLGLTGTIVGLMGSLVSKDLVDIITGHNAGELLKTFALFIGVNLLGSFLGQGTSYLSTKINMKVDNSIKANIFDEILISDWETLTKYHSGDLLVRWNGDASMVSSGILNLFPNVIIYSFKFFSALFMVIRYDASFAMFAVISIPISIFMSRRTMHKMQKGNMKTMTLSSKLGKFNQETFANLHLIKAFDMVELCTKRLRSIQTEMTEGKLKYQRIVIFNSLLMTVVSMFVSYSAYGWGIYKVWSGQITYGTMTMFLALASSLSASADNLISLVPNALTLTNAARRLMDIVGMPKEDYSKKSEVKEFYERHKDDGIGVYLTNVTYAYRGSDTVLENVSFEAYPHEVVALVGPSGEGKTTMLRYILSIISSQQGKGYICAGNGVDLDDHVDLSASARQLFAYVPQGNTMFYGTLSENMRNVKENATDEEIIHALKMACAWEFIEKLPEGINSILKERGGGFSEGQLQRLSIARALLRESPILLLDEATSALDMKTEKRVLENIMRDNYPRTTIVTTHRPSVLGMCTRVYEIHDKFCKILNKIEIEDMCMV